uniref:Uncharacterized protein n=1 Tax=Rhodosorus marinus TaxID=101924 RepID=A0A7S0BLJ3_9RHOD|mmetsp:Transcript_22146/g.32065  ORF Transcript_22146/g.32065 Transcript_22146/m.32065 type:complete len:105 (+) Transcript_22146:166-480(+)
MSTGDDDVRSKSILSKSLPASPIFHLMKYPASPKMDSDGGMMMMKNRLDSMPDSLPDSMPDSMPDFTLDSPPVVPQSADALQRASSVKKTAKAVMDYKDIWLSP